jgi:hypothetical protein
MRLPRIRMTTRRWMIAVAAIGLAMGGIVGVYRLKQRYDRDAARAERFALMFKFKQRCLGPAPTAKSKHAALEREYWKATLFRGLPVEPDPPEP